MRKKKLIKMLRSVSDETAHKLSRDYPPLTDKERDDLFERIEQKLQTRHQEETFPPCERLRPKWTDKLSVLFRRSAAAACVLVLCATFAAMYLMKNKFALPPEPQQADTFVQPPKLAYALGERFPADNLTRSGRLWITVTDAAYDGEYCHIRITLESYNAMSPSDNEVFMADNLMAATSRTEDRWNSVQPCAVTLVGEEERLPEISLHHGDKLELELRYRLWELPSELMLVTSYSAAYPYTVITTSQIEGESTK